MKITRKPKMLIAGGLLAVGCSDPAAELAGTRPNILIAIADDQSYPFAGAYGCNWIHTPAFDRVAAEGILFTNCYTPNAKSAPSRACLLTGRYSWQLEEAGNHIGYWPENSYPTFCETLSQNGYYTAFTGKGWAPGNPRTIHGKPRRLTGIPYQQQRLVPPTSSISKIDYAANFEQFLRQKPEGSPWVFWFGCHEPHRAYEYQSGVNKGGKSLADIDRIPPFWPDNDTVRHDLLDHAYEIEYFDSHLGRILDMLEASGELDNTIVVVTADNGMPFPRCKGLEYEYSNHLPLAVMWPAGIRHAGREESAYVSLIDWAPTFLRLAGVDAAANGMDPAGCELTDLLADAPCHDRSSILLGQERHDYGRPRNQGYPIRSIIEEGYLYIHNFKPELWPAGNPETGYLNTDGSPTKTTILEGRRRGEESPWWQLSFGKHPAEELYCLTTDRACMHNLAGEAAHAERMARMREKLFAQLRATGDPRVCGDGDIFDTYPFFQPTSLDFYERYMRGEATSEQTDWVNPSDYESAPLD